MFLSPTEEQSHIAEAVAEMLRAEAPYERWFMAQTDMIEEECRLLKFGAEMGWIGFAASPDLGGSGASAIEELLVIRELGARLAPLGIVPAAIAARIAAEASHDQLASEIISGEAPVAMSAGGDGAILVGAAGARYALCVSGSGLSLVRLSGEIPAKLGWDGMASVATLDAPPDPAAGIAATPETVTRFRLLVAAQLQAIARTAAAETVAYAKMREQFGRPIGSFQAVRHRAADMEMSSRRAEAALFYAGTSFEERRSDVGFQVLTALFLAMEAAMTNAQVNIANHGAIGVTAENIAHLLLKRALLWRSIMGGSEALLDRLALSDGPLV